MARMRSSALCLVPTRALLAQWQQQIAGAYAGPIGCYGDGTAVLRLIEAERGG
jgi:superfamily II DNA or RNA helicase